MPKLFEMKQLKSAALDKADAIMNAAERGQRDLTAPEKELLDRHMAEAKDLASKIEAADAANTLRRAPEGQGFAFAGLIPGSESAGRLDHARDARTGRNGSGAGVGAGAGEASLKEAMRGASSFDVEQVRAFGNYLAGDMTALADLTPTGGGGVFIPSIVAGVVARNYYAFTPVRNVATIWSTDNGEPATFPVISDSETATILAPAALTGADSIVSGDTPPTAITGPQMRAFKFSSKPIFCPREVITDASLNVLQELLTALLARIARTQNLKYTKGVGGTEPTGFLQDATAYSAGSVSLDLDIALDLAYSVPAMYRPQGVYMASDLTIKYLRKLKTGLSGDKRALWKDAFEEGNASLGTPARLHGYDILVNNDMDSVAADGTFANVSPLAFGDFKRVIIREAENGTPFTYRYDVPAKDGSAVVAFSRSDSKLIVSTAISKLTV